MFVNGDVLYTEPRNSGNTQYCFPFLNIACNFRNDKNNNQNTTNSAYT